ncbi:MAG TPA: helix-turn-helix domain-containing protein [Solirubrobacteraceae bacterium]|nr:helix-turn-helix domain-containing protein [Solirubrobacteraceae bacterium]
MSQRVPSDEARRRILAATRELLLDKSFAALTVGEVMARAGLTRTVFYRHFDTLAQMAPELLPDAEDPLVDQVLRGSPDELIEAMVTGLVQLYAEHGRMLRAIDAAAASSPEVAAELDRALVGPRRLLEELVAAAPHPPADSREFALLLMATHRAYLLDKFGGGDDSPEKRQGAIEALAALWQRLLAE